MGEAVGLNLLLTFSLGLLRLDLLSLCHDSGCLGGVVEAQLDPCVCEGEPALPVAVELAGLVQVDGAGDVTG